MLSFIATGLSMEDDDPMSFGWNELPQELKFIIMSNVLQSGMLKDIVMAKQVSTEWQSFSSAIIKEKTCFAFFLEKNPQGSANIFVKAAGDGKKEIVEGFLNAGIDVNVRVKVPHDEFCNFKETALTNLVKGMLRLIHKHQVTVLLARNFFNEREAFQKEQENCIQIAKLLIHAGADVNAQSCHVRILTIAKKDTNCEKLIKLLLNNGARKIRCRPQQVYTYVGRRLVPTYNCARELVG